MVQNFSVGPSAFLPNLNEKIAEILNSQICEKSHRSPEFTKMSQKTVSNLRRFLKIPENYEIFYTASSTEAMQIAIQNGVEKKSAHFSCGAFGEKWAKMAQNCGKEISHFAKNFGERHEISEIEIPENCETIFLTVNETSTGAAFSPNEISEIRKKFPEKLFCLDATSAAGAVDFEIANLDAFLFSVQKCFGVPSGLGILICSPRFFAKSEKINFKNHFHNLPMMAKKMREKCQTCETPPVLQIATLGAAIEIIENQIGDLKKCAEKTRQKAEILWNFFEQNSKFAPFVENKKHRSQTVIVVRGDENEIENAKKICAENEINLAGGYGKTKKNAFRIANFLASEKDDFEIIFRLLQWNFIVISRKIFTKKTSIKIAKSKVFWRIFKYAKMLLCGKKIEVLKFFCYNWERILRKIHKTKIF